MRFQGLQEQCRDNFLDVCSNLVNNAFPFLILDMYLPVLSYGLAIT